jgi:shikimate 5-dehydrogenase
MSLPRYAVIGNPIAHSLSPLIHEAFSRQTDIPLSYQRLEAPLDDSGRSFREVVTRFFDEGGRGLNVTAPFKHFALSFAREAAENAQRADAANTLTPLADGWRADNTDGIGFIRDLHRQWKRTEKDARILIFGAGGATAGILGALLAQTPREICLYNRTADKAQALQQRFANDEKITVLPSLDTVSSRAFDLIINGISVRAVDQNNIPWHMPVISPDTLFYDMVYSLSDTPFMRWAKTNGVDMVCDGLGMLIEQAAESFFIWHGVLPDTAFLHAPEAFSALRTARL